jgi:hypothetical protein
MDTDRAVSRINGVRVIDFADPIDLPLIETVQGDDCYRLGEPGAHFNCHFAPKMFV